MMVTSLNVLEGQQNRRTGGKNKETSFSSPQRLLWEKGFAAEVLHIIVLVKHISSEIDNV